MAGLLVLAAVETDTTEEIEASDVVRLSRDDGREEEEEEEGGTDANDDAGYW